MVLWWDTVPVRVIISPTSPQRVYSQFYSPVYFAPLTQLWEMCKISWYTKSSNKIWNDLCHQDSRNLYIEIGEDQVQWKYESLMGMFQWFPDIDNRKISDLYCQGDWEQYVRQILLWTFDIPFLFTSKSNCVALKI